MNLSGIVIFGFLVFVIPRSWTGSPQFRLEISIVYLKMIWYISIRVSVCIEETTNGVFLWTTPDYSVLMYGRFCVHSALYIYTHIHPLYGHIIYYISIYLYIYNIVSITGQYKYLCLAKWNLVNSSVDWCASAIMGSRLWEQAVHVYLIVCNLFNAKDAHLALTAMMQWMMNIIEL